LATFILVVGDTNPHCLAQTPTTAERLEFRLGKARVANAR